MNNREVNINEKSKLNLDKKVPHSKTNENAGKKMNFNKPKINKKFNPNNSKPQNNGKTQNNLSSQNNGKIQNNSNTQNNGKIQNNSNTQNNRRYNSNNVNKEENTSSSNNLKKYNNKPNFNKPNNGNNKVEKNIINKNELKIMALGGLGEVGKNCYVVEVGEKIYVIDFGVLFPDKDQLGIDYIIPNYTYLQENEHKIVGLFITHGHEDHIGGIPFLLKKVKIPKIYTPVTARLMIERKLKEHKLTNVTLVDIYDNSVLDFGEVKIHTFHQTHSIPDALGFFFETPYGNICTTGDFKIDFSPPGEKQPDFHRMADLSKKGVLCLMSDSTNALREGFSPSADEIGKNLKTLMGEAKGRILYTTFASHINRVEKIVEGALENNRKICILGRSMKTNLTIGIKTGYIKINKSDLIEPKEVKNYPDERVCILSTGSQGETLAALSRIAHGLNPYIELSETDTVVFASNPIPGNNYQIGKVIDQLYKTNCKIITNKEYFKTHTSGHASKEEEKLLLSMFLPKYFLPIHGTYNMLLEHKKTGMKLGIDDKDSFLIDNGDILHISDTMTPYIERNKIPGNSMYVSGNNIDVSVKKSNIFQLASDGILLITVLRKQNRDFVCHPQITTRGFIIINESIELLKKIQKKFINLYEYNKKLSDEKLKTVISEQLSTFILKETKKNPLIKINLIDYNPKKNK